MERPAGFTLEPQSGLAVLRLSGDWTAQGLGRAPDRLAASVQGAASQGHGEVGLDLAGLGRLDSAGALALITAARVGPRTRGGGYRADGARLVSLVSAASMPRAAAGRRRGEGVYALLVRIGRAVAQLGSELNGAFVFYGALVSALGAVLVHPRRIRLAPTVALMERAGLDALPIVAATNFFVGVTIGFLGEDLLQQFGAQVYSVELIGIGVLREFGVLVTALILAGRSASSFAAEIGAMKMNQEVDALQVMGVDPFEALVLPRFVAMLLVMPLLTFVAMISGLSGGLLVIWAVVGLSPAFFLERVLNNVGVVHFWIGMVKAPVMAVVIASIGCRQGLEVGGDVEQLGRRVTTAVVQALFCIIIIDSVFALLFLGVGE